MGGRDGAAAVLEVVRRMEWAQSHALPPHPVLRLDSTEALVICLGQNTSVAGADLEALLPEPGVAVCCSLARRMGALSNPGLLSFKGILSTFLGLCEGCLVVCLAHDLLLFLSLSPLDCRDTATEGLVCSVVR